MTLQVKKHIDDMIDGVGSYKNRATLHKPVDQDTSAELAKMHWKRSVSTEAQVSLVRAKLSKLKERYGMSMTLKDEY